ncbi:MAG TPA: M23 family metallopeptidase [Spirochaetota bacterium]|nr:M23 family metallopeptidase [Spirochaetota bacterium]
MSIFRGGGLSGRTAFFLYAFVVVTACGLALALGSTEKFSWPLGGLEQLSATLGEVRGRSLHTGVDIKTRGLNGHPVYAPAHGTVNRVLAKRSGYGNALFLSHGGIESVFGHLDSFGEGAARLNTFIGIVKLMYNSDEIDFRFKKTGPVFDRGQIVAYTGETGSGPPHLHYELRAGDRYINPLKFHAVRDTEPPVIDRLYICVEEEGSTVAERAIRVRRGWRGYAPVEPDVSCAPGSRVFLKLACYDRVNSRNSVAIHRIAVFENDKTIFTVIFDEVRYSDLQYGHMIYDISKSTIDGSATYTYFLCKRAGNRFSGIGAEGEGYIVPGRHPKRVRVVVSDFAGNSSVLELVIRGNGRPVESAGRVKFRRGAVAQLADASGAFSVRLRSDSLRSDALLGLEAAAPDAVRDIAGLGAVKEADLIAVCALQPFDLQYAAPVEIAMKGPRGRDIMIYQFFEGRPPRPIPTSYNVSRGEYLGRSAAGGYFALIRDTVPPVVSLPPTHEFLAGEGPYSLLRLQVYDGLSRLDESSLECMVDGESLPCAYDNDRRLVEIVLPRTAFDGAYHHVFLRCSDSAGNTAAFSSPLR